MLPISQDITLARSAGFAVSLNCTGMHTQGVFICNQSRTAALKKRNGKRIEQAPNFIVEDVLAHIVLLVT